MNSLTLSDSINSTSKRHSLPLPLLYSKAYEELRLCRSSSASTSSPSSSSSPITYSDVLTYFLSLSSVISKSHLISPNESIGEISTLNLRYLYVDYTLGEIWLEWPGIEGRRKRMEKAISSFFTYLSNCDHLEILTSSSDQQLYQQVKLLFPQYKSNQDEIELDKKIDPHQQRADKIARYKREKELSNSLESYEQSKSHRREQAGEAIDPEVDDSVDSVDEDLVREYWMSKLQLAIMKSLDHLKISAQEMEFLREREEREEKQKENQLNTSDKQQQKQKESAYDNRNELNNHSNSTPHQPAMYQIKSSAQLNQPIPAHMKQYLHNMQTSTRTHPDQKSTADYSSSMESFDRPIFSTIPSSSSSFLTSTLDSAINSRSNIRSTVFRDPNPALLSVEEWADNEIREGRMQISEVNEKGNRKTNYILSSQQRDEEDVNHSNSIVDGEDLIGEKGGEIDNNLLDDKRRTDREWDNWKDDHEKGAGNRKK